MGNIDPLAESPAISISFKSKHKDKCVTQDTFLTPLVSGEFFECVIDFNPHLVECNPRDSNYIKWEQGWSNGFCSSNCEKTIYPYRCLRPGAARSCDNAAVNYRNYELRSSHDTSKEDCGGEIIWA